MVLKMSGALLQAVRRARFPGNVRCNTTSGPAPVLGAPGRVKKQRPLVVRAAIYTYAVLGFLAVVCSELPENPEYEDYIPGVVYPTFLYMGLMLNQFTFRPTIPDHLIKKPSTEVITDDSAKQ
jgi:hypothetical protein